MDHCKWFSTRFRPNQPILRRNSGPPIRVTIALANAASSLGGTYKAASWAEYRVSARSKETMGFAYAMYSMIFTQVDTSFRGLDGSGSTHTSAPQRGSL